MKIIPALLAGNSVVLKVSPENSLSISFLAELLERVGLPEGVISVLSADRDTSEYLVSHREGGPRITEGLEKGNYVLAVARRIRIGTVTVNDIGREYGVVGLGSYTAYKTITV